MSFRGRPSVASRRFGRGGFSRHGVAPNQQKDNDQSLESINASMDSINNINDIRGIIINSKLNIPLSKLILKSSFKDEFIVLFLVLLNTVDLHSNAKINFLVSTFDLKLYDLSKSLLETNKYTFIEISKCLKIMDSKRMIKILNKRLEEIKSNHERKLKEKKLAIEKSLEQLSVDDNEIQMKKEEKKQQEHKRYLEKVEKRKKRIEEFSKKVDQTKSKKQYALKKVLIKMKEQKKVEKVVKGDKEVVYKNRYENAVKSVENKIRELVSYQYESGLSGNVIAIFKKFFKQVPRSTLEYFAYGQPKATWREIARLLHLGPKDLCDEIPWFLSVMFGGSAPVGTRVYEFEKELKDPSKFTKERAIELINQFKPTYAFLRKNLPESLFDGEMKAMVAEYEEIDALIWWLNELGKEEKVIEIIIKRITSGKESLKNVSIGTLLERSMGLSQDSPLFNCLFPEILKKMTEQREKFVLPPPISIFGDKSGSMDVAIRLSNIISFIISSLTPGAELSFFDCKNVPSPIPVDSLENLFKLKDLVKASGGTDPGVSMYKLLSEKVVKNYIVVVTDEEENGYKHGRFSELFIQYRKEVAPNCKLVFISFIPQYSEGQMVGELRRKGFDSSTLIQIPFDATNPDVSKIDGMLSSLSCESEQFKDQLDLLVTILSTVGYKNGFKFINDRAPLLMRFDLNIQLGIENVLSIIKTNPTLDNYQYLMVKNNLNRLLKISKDNNDLVSLETFNNIHKEFSKLSKDDGIQYLLKSLSNLQPISVKDN
ncbi:hypothetical protein DDB_G0276681 [Dictyostelium discoideum AX4]|uniref:Uncharacterized protein n=1 Tax=Dictyostelium discoideum TaxID=44689 RepID=Q551A9_DICDI|nr:hypothetical protein DDB_G0276681 [Dictyostelium discoideum AX4]EAL69098.1 hypothetical protein DDB_G0276681 [Dictyostelium discoideum AX4]|eukprot:XP_643029.1 hypothetical protein DDB_G0276681 [Dictyostelium discoideum AX4]